ncbi:MAG TPA: S53 family peptidase [Solirubrobacteraceae bacterium]
MDHIAVNPQNARAFERPRRTLLLLLLACVLVTAAAFCANASAALSPSEYRVSSLCSAPAPGYAGCMGLRLVARDSVSQASEVTKPPKKALTPANVLGAYGLTGLKPPTAQTIAIVDAFDDPTIAEDLQVFSAQFGLPACTEANGCFRKVNQAGATSPLPASGGAPERSWAQEIATDVQVAHGICPSCRILLVEAESNANANLYAAEQTAASLGATEISNSWGGEEPLSDSPAFDHPGIVITASSGDYGYLNWFAGASEYVDYPASSPHVVAVGGTRLSLNATTRTRESETVWNDGGVTAGGAFKGAGAGGSGCSMPFAAPAWQQSLANWSFVGCGSRRAVADVSADADPYTGVAIYDSTESEGSKGWATIGGTSVAAPIIASVFALAGGAHGVAYPARTLYENALQSPASLHDVTVGSNGECRKPFEKSTGTSGCTTAEEAQTCSGQAICLAGGGYDGATGVGTPNGVLAFAPSGTISGAVEETGEAATGGSGAPAAAQPPTGTSAPGAGLPATTAAAPPAPATPPTPVVSALALTRSAKAALSHRRARLSKLGFSFTLSAPARVRVTVYRRVRVHGHVRWKAVSSPSTIAAFAGAQSRRLGASAALFAGQYRLTLQPERATASSIAFRVG